MSSTMELALERAQDELDEDAVRTAMEAALIADSRKLMQVQPEIGIPYGTLSAWRGGKYAGDTVRVALAVQAWLTTRDAHAHARATLPVEPDFIMTRTASQIWDLLEFAMTTPAIGVVIGGAGVGKTRAFEAYQERLPQTVWIATMHPCHDKIGAVLREIALTLNIGAPHRSSDVARGIVQRLRGTRGLLIVDEAQHLRSETLDQLRSIYDASKTGLVLGGNKELWSHMGADRRREQLAQIYRRIGMRYVRDRSQRADVNALADAWGVKGEPERAELRGIALQPGGVGVMSMVLRIAFGMAAGAGVTLEHIRGAFAQLSGTVAGGGA